MSYLWYWPAGGWDFDAWKAKQDGKPIRSEQSGERGFLPLVTAGETQGGWREKSRRWRGIVGDLLGAVSDRPPARVHWEFLGDTLRKREDPPYTLRRLRYRLTDAEWGYAWLLTPTGAHAPRPAVIALHQTVPQGKTEPVGLETSPERPEGRDYAKELAEQGFVVLAPDAIGFGERQAGHVNARYRSAAEFFAAHPHGSVMAKMAFDTSRAVDLLQQLPEVDGGRIGCIGHSHGGYGTLFAMIADERIKAGAISCGVTMLRTDPSPDRWWRKTALIPRLGLYEGRIEESPLDLHHLLALVAPRPLLVSAALDDAIFPRLDRLPEVLALARDVYGLYGAADRLQSHIFQGGHSFPRPARDRAYRLLRDALKR